MDRLLALMFALAVVAQNSDRIPVSQSVSQPVSKSVSGATDRLAKDAQAAAEVVKKFPKPKPPAPQGVTPGEFRLHPLPLAASNADVDARLIDGSPEGQSHNNRRPVGSNDFYKHKVRGQTTIVSPPKLL